MERTGNRKLAFLNSIPALTWMGSRTLLFLFLLVLFPDIGQATWIGPENGRDYEVLGSPVDEVFLTKLKLIQSTGRVNVYRGEVSIFSNPEASDFTVPFYYYKSRRKGPRPTLIVSPSLAGITLMEKGMAMYMASKGFSSLLFDPKIPIQDLERRIEEVDPTFKVALYSLKLMVDWVYSRPEEFDRQKIGAFGISLGGILSSILFGQDSRVKAGFLVVAGGDLPSVLAKGNERFLKEYRRKRICEEKLDGVKGYEAALRAHLTIDPTRLSIRRNSDDLYMMMGGADQVVPYKNQRLLWEALGRPKYTLYRSQGHTVTAGLVPFHIKKIMNFFCWRWSLTPPFQDQDEDIENEMKVTTATEEGPLFSKTL